MPMNFIFMVTASGVEKIKKEFMRILNDFIGQTNGQHTYQQLYMIWKFRLFRSLFYAILIAFSLRICCRS